MRIEAGSHPAALHITDVYLDGRLLPRGIVRWLDVERGQIGAFQLDDDGGILIENGGYVLDILHGRVHFDLPEEHQWMLDHTWQ